MVFDNSLGIAWYVDISELVMRYGNENADSFPFSIVLHQIIFIEKISQDIFTVNKDEFLPSEFFFLTGVCKQLALAQMFSSSDTLTSCTERSSHKR